MADAPSVYRHWVMALPACNHGGIHPLQLAEFRALHAWLQKHHGHELCDCPGQDQQGATACCRPEHTWWAGTTANGPHDQGCQQIHIWDPALRADVEDMLTCSDRYKEFAYLGCDLDAMLAQAEADLYQAQDQVDSDAAPSRRHLIHTQENRRDKTIRLRHHRQPVRQ